jgi:hypothetical protein
MSLLPSCPTLPPSRPDLDWQVLHAFREGDRGGPFYFACLEYGQFLWENRLPARAILCLDRAFGADVTAEDPAVAAWPMPYAALVWMLRFTPTDVFVGNPRVHFQHYADRLKEPRREQRRWRAWGCWALTRAVRPEWPADPRHAVEEPSLPEIEEALERHGFPGEANLWRRVLTESGPAASLRAPA